MSCFQNWLLNSLQKEVFEYTRIHSLLVNGVVTASNHALWRVLSNIMIWLLGHFWVDTPHINTFERDSVFKITLLEAPTGTLLFYYKDIKQEIVHTLLLEEYGVSKKCVIIMDSRQDWNVTLTSARKSGPWAQDRYCARGFGGGAKNGVQTKKIEISLVFVTIMLHVLTYVVSNKKNGNWNGVVQFVSQEVWFDKVFVI